MANKSFATKNQSRIFFITTLLILLIWLIGNNTVLGLLHQLIYGSEKVNKKSESTK